MMLMSRTMKRWNVQPALWLASLAAMLPVHAADAPAGLQPRPAAMVAHAASAAMLGSARAGTRLVAVGDHGVVLLSDDGGRQWRQAQAVPVRSALTSVSFADDKRGWAVGHWGVVLSTLDGGETWQLQRISAGEDRPLFAVQAFDARRVLAVGLWSLVLASSDGGQSWSPVPLPPPPVPEGQKAGKADLNLFGLFTDAQGRVFAAAERGMVLRSDDRGASWTYLPTGYKGSFWTGASPAPGVLVAAGLRGSIYRSADDGKTWSRIESGSKASITAIAHDGGQLVAVGSDGLLLRSHNQGASFAAEPRSDRAALTAAVPLPNGGLALLSRNGVVGK